MLRFGWERAAARTPAAALRLEFAGTSYGFVGHTALHYCAAKGHVACLRTLLLAGADVNATNRGGSTVGYAPRAARGGSPARSAGLRGCTQWLQLL